MAKKVLTKTSSAPLEEYYNSHHLAENSRKGYYREKVDFFCDHLHKLSSNQKNKIKILDVACNDGELTKRYQKYGDVIGTEINRNAVKQCIARGVDCRCADLPDLINEFKNSFDVVIAGDIIEHIFDTDKFLEDIKKLLKPGGILLLSTPNLTSFGRRIMFLFGKNPFIEFSSNLPTKEFNVGHIRYYTVENMLMQMTHAGYKNIKIYGDKINITGSISIPFSVAKQFPTFSRNIIVYAEKNK